MGKQYIGELLGIMAHVAPIYPSFSRGEVSPLMLGRIDIEQYPACLEKCRNTYIRPYGCATRLTGTEYIAQTKTNGKVRLLKFVFSAHDSYIIECGSGYFRFYQNGGAILKSSAPVWSKNTSYVRGDFVTYNGDMYYCKTTHTSSNVNFAADSANWNQQDEYEVPNGYYEDQLDSIQYVQLDDIIKLTCLPHNNNNATAKPKELIRNASDDWTFRDVTFIETPYLDANTSSRTMTPSAVTGNITITCSGSYFTSDMVGANMWIGVPVKDTATNKDVQGFVKITGYTSATEVTATVQSKLSGTEATKLWGEGAFSDKRGYPAVVALYDGRLYYARTPYQPRNIYGSKPYAYETFTPPVNNEDDGAINIQLATNANGDGSDIKWMIGASYLLCGTYGGEFVIRGTGDGAITPTDISARQRTNWGGEPIQPIVAGTFVHFLQRNGNKLRQFQYDFYYDSYKAVDISIFSEHLLASPIKGMALQKNPDSIIYLVREDGDVVMLTLEQDQSVQAWSLLEEMGAKVESIQTIPSYEGNYDEVYMVMNRLRLATTLTINCSNPELTVTSNYSGTKKTEGTEVIELTYNSGYEAWTTPEGTELRSNLTVSSSNPDLNPTTNYSGTQPAAGTRTEELVYKKSYSKFQYAREWSIPKINSTLDDDYTWVKTCYVEDEDTYVAIAENGNLAISEDGVNWTVQLFGALGQTFTSITSANIEGYDNLINILALTTDGRVYEGRLQNGHITISGFQLSPVTSDKWKAIAYGAINGTDIIMLITEDGYTVKLDEYFNPISEYFLTSSKVWVDVAYDGEKFVVLSQDGYISTNINEYWNPIYKVNQNYPTIFGPTFVSISKSFAYPSARKNVILLTYKGEVGTGNTTDGFIFNPGVSEVSYNEWQTVSNNNDSYIVLGKNGYLANCVSGDWYNEDEMLIDITKSPYEITLNSIPEEDDILYCTWNTISNAVNPSKYNLTITGTPENNDVITLTYITEYTFSGNRYIERMKDPITPENQNEWWYVRSGLKYDGFEITKGITLTLSANTGTVTATASSTIFNSGMVGNRIRFIDDDYNVLGEGTITALTNTATATLNITTYFQSLTISGGKWGISTDTLSGLTHLNNKEVQVYADCIQQPNKRVTNGSIEIDDAFIAVVGLPYTSYITTMPMEAGSQNGTAVGKRKRISEMAIRVWNSLGVRVGRDFEHLYDTIYEQKEPFTGIIPNIKYNQGWVWDANITVEQSKPYSMNILSIAPLVTEVDK